MNAARTRLAELITAFFTNHLTAERHASSHTIARYRDTFRVLLIHVAESTGRQVSQLTLDDFSPDAILRFLEFLEQHRGNSVSTRNARLAAIRAFCAYVATRDPAAAAPAQKILHIPFKKGVGRVVGHLAKDGLEAILAQPDRTTRKGRRDYLVLALLYDTGARVQAHLKTLEAYVQADLEMKRRALEDTPTPVTIGQIVQRHEPDILRWLEEL